MELINDIAGYILVAAILGYWFSALVIFGNAIGKHGAIVFLALPILGPFALYFGIKKWQDNRYPTIIMILSAPVGFVALVLTLA